MKSILLLLSLFVAVNTLLAQDLSVRFGESEKERDGKKHNYFPYFIGKDSTDIYVLRVKKIKELSGNSYGGYKNLYHYNDQHLNDLETFIAPRQLFTSSPKIYLEIYDKNLNLKSKNYIDFDKLNLTLKKSILHNGEVYFIGTRQKGSIAQTGYIVLNGNQTFSDFNIIDSFYFKYLIFDKSFDKFKYVSSENNSTHAVFKSWFMGQDVDPREIYITLLDNKLQPIENKYFKLDKQEKRIYITRLNLSNDGTLVFSVNMYPYKHDKTDGIQKFRTSIFVSKPQNKDIQEIPLEFEEDIVLQQPTFHFNKKNQLIITGIYSDTKKYKTNGIYLIVYDLENLSVTSKFIKEISDKDKQILNRNKNIITLKNSKEISFFQIRNIYENSNGSYTLLAENYNRDISINSKSTTQYNASGSPVSTVKRSFGSSYRYEYEDIMIINFDENNGINWVNKIEKNQVTKNDLGFYSSFISLFNKDNIFILYNGNKTNSEMKVKNMKNSVNYISKVDINGKITTDPFFSSKDEDVIMNPRLSLKDEDKIIFHNIKKRKFKISEVSIK